jgi:hypothetical protein
MAEGERNGVDGDVTEDDEIVFNVQRHGDRGDGPPRNEMRNKPIKVDNFSGDTQSWTIWHRMFEKIARINEWEHELATHLFGLLRGPALEVACGLPDEDLENYNSLVNVLETQFGPGRQAGKHLAELRNRIKSDTESFRELGRSISKLCSLAYPESTYEERQRHAKIYFVEAILESELRVMISTARPANLDDAICLAEEFEGIRRLERQRNNQKGSNRSNVRNVNTETKEADQSGQMTKIEHLLEKLCENTFRNQRSGNQRSYNPDRYRDTRCWQCNGQGHIQRRCPYRQGENEKNVKGPGPRDTLRL